MHSIQERKTGKWIEKPDIIAYTTILTARENIATIMDDKHYS